MKLAIIGLGRMGGGIARRLIRAGHQVVGYDRDEGPLLTFEKEGGQTAPSLEAIRTSLDPTAVCWVMLPEGPITEGVIQKLQIILQPGDILIDGGNTHYKDDIRRSPALEERGIRYLDIGTSGGIWGLERGFSLMIGGDPGAARELTPIFEALAPSKTGYHYCGPAGAGHFVKMVHNGIEYGMMQALAEGFDLLNGASGLDSHYKLDLAKIAEVWRKGSVVSSWLLDLTAQALSQDPELQRFEGRVPDSGEGRWTVQAAIEAAVPVHVISAALFERFRSRRPESFADKLLSAMRNEFGGHHEETHEKKAG